MGALAPVSPWIPEDDLLLKNAVEAGASLESLAKGAVQFSQKFTVHELQDRWHSLLYDPVISAEASYRMTEFERSTSYLPPKFSRTGNSKESKSFSGKRKTESVRNCYYALRKRIRNEPFNSMDLSFLIAPSDSNFIGHEAAVHLRGDGILQDSTSNHLGFEESQLEIIHRAFPQILVDDVSTARDDGIAHGFHSGFENPVEDIPMQKEGHAEIPHILTDNLDFTGNGSGIEELGQQKELPENSMFGSGDLVSKPSSTLCEIDSHPGNTCSNFEGNQVFSSPIPECGASFHNLDYASPLPAMPIWKAVEGISAPDIPVDVSIVEDMHGGHDGNSKLANTSGLDVIQKDPKLKLQIPSDELKSPTASTDCYLAEISSSLFNEEELFIDVDGKDIIDKSYYDGLSSLLLNSPNDVNQDQMPSSTEPGTSITLDCPNNGSNACPGELDYDKRSDFAVGGDAASNSEAQMPSVQPDSDPRFPEMRNGVICCILSTEDEEIPCNDDVFISTQIHSLSSSSLTRRNCKESSSSFSTSVRDFSVNPERGEGCPAYMQRDRQTHGQSRGSSLMTGSPVMPETGRRVSGGECGVKFPGRDSSVMAPSSTGINSTNVSRDACLPTRLKEESREITIQDSLTEKAALGSDTYKSYPQKHVGGIKQELDVPPTTQNHQASNAGVQSVDMSAPQLVVHPPPSEPDEPPIESDDDVPYYSDIEAMILDMDLDPDDQDLYDLQVSRYQHEDTKRAIIRLEQGAHSYMQRAIASHGAFAIFYGRHSKHYIKKPEVLLGRATEDVIVDIDLAREGRANKISRRQAMIHLDKGGSFYLKNIGKFSISVDNKEVAPGKSLSLHSSCLIEIRGMPFIFESNQARVKQYLESVKTDQSQKHRS